jgi:hypothetical protein
MSPGRSDMNERYLNENACSLEKTHNQSAEDNPHLSFFNLELQYNEYMYIKNKLCSVFFNLLSFLQMKGFFWGGANKH